MLSQVILWSVLAAPSLGLAGDATVVARGIGPHVAFAQSPEVVPAAFVQVRRGLAREFRQRFQVQVASGAVVDFEFVANGLVTLNGQPARLQDLRRGDRVLLFRPDSLGPIITQITAESAVR